MFFNKEEMMIHPQLLGNLLSNNKIVQCQSFDIDVVTVGLELLIDCGNERKTTIRLYPRQLNGKLSVIATMK